MGQRERERAGEAVNSSDMNEYHVRKSVCVSESALIAVFASFPRPIKHWGGREMRKQQKKNQKKAKAKKKTGACMRQLAD